MKTFDISTQTATETSVTVGGKRKTDLLSQPRMLTEIVSVSQTPMGPVKATTYVDDEMNAVKLVSPILGMRIEMIACPKEVALSPAEPVDFFDKMLLESPEPLGGLGEAKGAVYILAPKAGHQLDIPTLDGQTVRKNEDKTLVAVRPVKPKPGGKLPYAGDDKDLLAAMKPTRYVQSDDKTVVKLAGEAVGDETEPATAARRIEAFVRKHIDKKTLNVGYASAAEVAEAREGDCTEHAVLTAALCRAAGLPAKVAVGVAYVDRLGAREHVFGPHAWTLVWVNGKWVGLDAALPAGFDAGHIALSLGDGDPMSFFGLVNSLGFFTIAEVRIEE